MQEIISIVIPVYNDNGTLKDALVSIRAQTYEHLQIIVVDDGSKIPIPNLGSDVEVIRQDNKGAPAARNVGLQKATGTYVIFWDDDVIAIPTMLEKMVDALQKEKGKSFSYCNMSYGNKKMPGKSYDSRTLRERNYIHSTSLIKRESCIKWDESLKRFQDWDLWLSMAEQGKTGVWIDEYLFTVKGKGAMSTWLPSFVYKVPWKWFPGLRKKVSEYEKAREVIAAKHHL